MNSIIYDNKIITPQYNIWGYYNSFANKLDQKGCVKFSLFCAKISNPNIKESNDCIELVEKWLIDENSVTAQELHTAFSNIYTVGYSAYSGSMSASASAKSVYYTVHAVYYTVHAAYFAADAAYCTIDSYASVYPNIIYSYISDIDEINKYLQILLRKTKQFGNNKILEQISKTDVDRLELVDWNMITDIIQEDYDIVHEFSYEDIFSRRCLIELLRREYT